MPQLNYKRNLTSMLLAMLSVMFSSCKDSSKQAEVALEPVNSEVRIELVPIIQPGEENMSESERMMKRFNETKVVTTKFKELEEEMNNPANWKEITKEDLKAKNISPDTDTEATLKQIVKDSYQNTKNKKAENKIE